jgi:Ca2+-dependent lipid-binding protein
LNPEWNEQFEVRIVSYKRNLPKLHLDLIYFKPSRTAADFSVEVFDWNQVEQAKSLGVARIELNALEPFQDSEHEFTLHSPKFGEKGKIRMRMNFRSEYLIKSKKTAQLTLSATAFSTTAFSATALSATKTMTQIGNLPVQAGKGVLQGVTNVFKKEKDPMKPIIGQDGSLLELPVEQAVGNSAGHPTLNLDNGSSEENKPGRGTLKLTVLEAENLAHHDVKPYVTVRVGDKEVKTKPAGKVEKPEWYADLFIRTIQRFTL